MAQTTFTCFGCNTTCTYERGDHYKAGRRRWYCDGCRRERRNLDHKLRINDRYHQARDVGYTSVEAGALARSSWEKFSAAIEERKRMKEAGK